MKKNILLFLILILSFSILTGCGKSNKEENTIKIGVSPVPHKEIVENIKDDLKSEGINLEIIEFIDYVKPNLALADKEIDANFFQHEPYMNDFKKERNIDIASLGKIHVEPLGLYSSSYKSIDELKEGSTIAIPNDPTNGGRALLLLEKNGLIKLNKDSGLAATEKDIEENPKNISFKPMEAAQLPRVLKDIDGAVINGNYAIEAGLTPTKDALILEDKDSPYANIIAIRAGEEKEEKFQKLIKTLQSEKIKKFIEEKYNGAVIPGF
ncbi:MetQ/NlpA family ABC transporter substrate-binding protein [Anaerosalibacter massiliensis]|uniref:Lipoprotein n=1 Tax=Anaerosalibacter massiliensis TaxID=1347392 RepID=A0A9X2MJK6_9FIRM|nr:MetQ/NlpA family ABC transporter substrate-binding protein [Anaerosalibacter massiliensis]MCR2045230.1 MetQ/NlpA family ABC transporter substrate-binding protein [Anaerosalibacter massiliensis]